MSDRGKSPVIEDPYRPSARIRMTGTKRIAPMMLAIFIARLVAMVVT